MREDQELDGLPGHSEAAGGAVGGEAGAFTPGPWVCREYGSPRGRYYVQDARGASIAQSLKCSLADARLIAAAPDLLRAGNELSVCVADLAPHFDKPVSDHLHKWQRLDRAQKAWGTAIAKALGPSAPDTTEPQVSPGIDHEDSTP